MGASIMLIGDSWDSSVRTLGHTRCVSKEDDSSPNLVFDITFNFRRVMDVVGPRWWKVDNTTELAEVMQKFLSANELGIFDGMECANGWGSVPELVELAQAALAHLEVFPNAELCIAA